MAQGQQIWTYTLIPAFDSKLIAALRKSYYVPNFAKITGIDECQLPKEDFEDPHLAALKHLHDNEKGGAGEQKSEPQVHQGCCSLTSQSRSAIRKKIRCIINVCTGVISDLFIY